MCIKEDDDPISYKGKYTLTIPIYVGFERYAARSLLPFHAAVPPVSPHLHGAATVGLPLALKPVM